MPPHRTQGARKDETRKSESSPVSNRKRSKNKIKDHGKNPALAKGRKFVVRPLKDRIRDLRRLLNAPSDLPADVKQGYEREIQALQHEVIAILVDREKHEMIGRYHMVRFFERQKATRKLKKAKKALDECTLEEDKEDLTSQAHLALIELNYTIYYPYMTPYHSLWTRTTDKDGNHHHNEVRFAEDGTKGNSVVWKQVEQATKDGTLDKLKDMIDDEKLEQIRQSVLKVPETKSTNKENNSVEDQTTKTAEADDELDDDNGVGFFE